MTGRMSGSGKSLVDKNVAHILALPGIAQQLDKEMGCQSVFGRKTATVVEDEVWTMAANHCHHAAEVFLGSETDTRESVAHLRNVAEKSICLDVAAVCEHRDEHIGQWCLVAVDCVGTWREACLVVWHIGKLRCRQEGKERVQFPNDSFASLEQDGKFVVGNIPRCSRWVCFQRVVAHEAEHKGTVDARYSGTANGICQW